MSRSESLLKLKVKESKTLLKELLALTTAINNNRKASELYQLFEKILFSDLGIKKYAFYRSIDRSWVRVFSKALSEQDKEINVKDHLLQYKDLKALINEQESKLSGFDYLIPVYHKERALGYILLKENKDENEFSPIIRNLNFIQTLANLVVVAIENKRLFKEQLKKEGESREMELAAKIQRSLLPSPIPENENFESAAIMQTHHNIGGDYYDVVRNKNGNHIFLIADISGKGTSAALIMSNLQAFFRSTCLYETSIERIFKALNKNLNRLELEDKFITLFMAEYDPQEKTLRFINAGHPEQFLLNGSGIRALKSSCSPLGVRTDQDIRIQEVEVKAGDVLFCYTDGLIDVYNENEWLSEDGLEKILLKTKLDQSLEEIQRTVLEESLLFSGRIDRDDDVALLCVRFV